MRKVGGSSRPVAVTGRRSITPRRHLQRRHAAVLHSRLPVPAEPRAQEQLRLKPRHDVHFEVRCTLGTMGRGPRSPVPAAVDIQVPRTGWPWTHNIARDPVHAADGVAAAPPPQSA